MPKGHATIGLVHSEPFTLTVSLVWCHFLPHTHLPQTFLRDDVFSQLFLLQNSSIRVYKSSQTTKNTTNSSNAFQFRYPAASRWVSHLRLKLGDEADATCSQEPDPATNARAVPIYATTVSRWTRPILYDLKLIYAELHIQ